MKKFDILRYLRRFFALVLAVTMAGTVVVYWYCKNNQTYTASVNIKYLHDGIKDGFAPDGTAMNVDEIYSSKVISQAMESLGLQSGINLVRSHCTVEELIPDDQKALQEALIDKGEESTYFPDEYKVTLVVDGSLGASYARRVLDAIVSSYSTIYTEEYVELPLTMNPSSGLLNSGYDYYECVDVLSSDTTEVLNYLEDKKTNYPNFRSSVTGYSYEDLYDIYKMLYDYEIPSLYANVMTAGAQRRQAVPQPDPEHREQRAERAGVSGAGSLPQRPDPELLGEEPRPDQLPLPQRRQRQRHRLHPEERRGLR